MPGMLGFPPPQIKWRKCGIFKSACLHYLSFKLPRGFGVQQPVSFSQFMKSPLFSIVSVSVIVVAVMVAGIIPWLGLGLIVMVLLVALGLLAYRLWQR